MLFSEAEFDQKFASFVEGCRAIVAINHTETTPSLRQPWLEVDKGTSQTRYIRIWKCDDWNCRARELNGYPDDKLISKSCFCYVDSHNGNVLKSAGRKAPEKKHPRGNIFNEDNGLSKMTPQGAHYIR